MEETKDVSMVHHGENVRAARNMRGFKQHYLAEELGIHQTLITSLERKKTIDKELLDKIAKALDVRVEFLETFVPNNALGSYNTMNDINSTNNDQAKENIISQNDIEVDTFDNSVPESVIKEYMAQVKEAYTERHTEVKELLAQIADMRVLLQKHNIDYPGK